MEGPGKIPGAKTFGKLILRIDPRTTSNESILLIGIKSCSYLPAYVGTNLSLPFTVVIHGMTITRELIIVTHLGGRLFAHTRIP